HATGDILCVGYPTGKAGFVLDAKRYWHNKNASKIERSRERQSVCIGPSPGNSTPDHAECVRWAECNDSNQFWVPFRNNGLKYHYSSTYGDLHLERSAADGG